MIRHKQLYRHEPENGVYGDCQRTVFACMLDAPSPEYVPHFAHDGPPDGVANDRRDLWLRSQGFALAKVLFPGDTPLQDVLHHMGVMNPGMYYMLAGTSRNGCGHVVVGFGDAIYHDTSLDDSGIVGPASDGYWWVEWMVPLRFTEKKAVSDAVRAAHRPFE